MSRSGVLWLFAIQHGSRHNSLENKREEKSEAQEMSELLDQKMFAIICYLGIFLLLESFMCEHGVNGTTSPSTLFVTPNLLALLK